MIAVAVDEVEARVERFRARCCTDKAELAPRTARRLAARSRGPAATPGYEGLDAYRCPFAADHVDSTLDFHLGHPMTTETMVELAWVIRARTGNAP